jgi:hypothetical protein
MVKYYKHIALVLGISLGMQSCTTFAAPKISNLWGTVVTFTKNHPVLSAGIIATGLIVFTGIGLGIRALIKKNEPQQKWKPNKDCAKDCALVKKFETVCNKFIKTCNAEMTTANFSIKSESEEEGKDDQTNEFVLKLEVPATATIKVMTDIHGTVQPVCDWLKQLQDEGFIDKNDPFKIIQKDGYIIFLGDYVDCGPCSTETLIAVMQLYIENPGHVIMIHGNHEDSDIWTQSEFSKELDTKSNKKLKTQIESAFNLLPYACYLVWPSTTINQKNCILFTHAGPHLGYDPQQVLQDTKTLSYGTIKTTDTFVNKTKGAHALFIKPKPQSNPFAWIDFALDDSKNEVDYKCDQGRIKIFNVQIYYGYIKQMMPAEFTFFGTIRGHQQGDREMREWLNNGMGTNVLIPVKDKQFDEKNGNLNLNDLYEIGKPFVITLDCHSLRTHSEGIISNPTRATLSLSLAQDPAQCTVNRVNIKETKANILQMIEEIKEQN